jgi:hypothetical protein
MSRATDVKALQVALAAEHAAIYGYGVVGAYLSGAQRRLAAQSEVAHRARRDQLRELLARRGATPAPAAAAYHLPSPVVRREDAVALAVHLEERLAAVWVNAVGELTDQLRVLAARALQDAAVRAALWRGRSAALPGLA